MIKTNQKLEIFQELYKDNLDQTLDNLLAFKLEDYRRSQREYEQILSEFEQQYDMPSDEFYEAFEAGELGDATDFFEWSGIYELYQYVNTRIAQIEQVL